MPTTSTITLTTSRGTSTHVISLTQGISAGFFWSMLAGFVFFIVAFSTVGWYNNTNRTPAMHIGLWGQCQCYPDTALSEGWFQATRAMMVIALIGFCLVVILCFIYMFLHSVNKNLVIYAFTGLCFATVLFMLIGIIVFGSKISSYKGNVSYSFVFAIFGMMLCFAAGILSSMQIWRSGSVVVTAH